MCKIQECMGVLYWLMSVRVIVNLILYKIIIRIIYKILYYFNDIYVNILKLLKTRLHFIKIAAN